jgi:glutamyl-Q tRNA(Asp) synthetase
VRDERGDKLSKSNGAPALDVGAPLVALRAAGEVLELPRSNSSTHERWLQEALPAWRQRWRA